MNTKPTPGAINAALALAETSVRQYYTDHHAHEGTEAKFWHLNAREEVNRVAAIIDQHVRASELINRAHENHPAISLTFNSWLPDKQFHAVETLVINAVTGHSRQRDAFGNEPEEAIAACLSAEWQEIQREVQP